MKYHKANGYIQIPSKVIKDKSLSLESKGLYGIIEYYSKLPGFALNRTYISKRHDIGTYALKSCMAALSEKNYASCTRQTNRWVYKASKVGDTYTKIPKTILSSDLSLREIGLFMVIAYAITLPDVKLNLDLYSAYCSDCKRIVMTISKKLQLQNIYLVKKNATCKYTYTLQVPDKKGTYITLASATTKESKNMKEQTPQPAAKNEQTTKKEPVPYTPEEEKPSRSGQTPLSIKDLLFYDHETRSMPFTDFHSACILESRRMAYDMMVSAIHFAAKAKYITANGQKIYYEKFYSHYVCKLGNRTIREDVVKRILDSINGDSAIRNLDLYICGLICKTVPIATLQECKGKKDSYEMTEKMFGKAIANEEYASDTKNEFTYYYQNGHFYRGTKSSAFCA